jgi:hypothetical protein
VERDAEPSPQLGRLGAALGVDQDHLGGSEAAELVRGHLHHVLIADPGRSRDPGLGQHRGAEHQVVLSPQPPGLQVRGPALEEVAAAGGDQEQLWRAGILPDDARHRFRAGVVEGAAEHQQDAPP